MNLNNKAILDAVLETLRNDAKLSTYVKKFSSGAMGASRKLFPFVEVGNFHIRPEITQTASVHLLYTIEIIAGTRSLIPGVAYLGNDSGVKGINDLCDDICDAVRGKSFNDLLYGVYDITSDPNYRRDKGETMHFGLISFKGKHMARL